MKKSFNIIVGSLFIALAFNLFLLPYGIISTGFFGIAILMNYEHSYQLPLFILVMNMACIIAAYYTLNKEKVKEYVIPGFLIPLFIYLSTNLYEIINFNEIETILAVIAGSFLTGIGISLLCKEGRGIGGIDAIQDIINSAKIYRTKTFIYLAEGIILIGTLIILNLEVMLYSLINIAIIRILGSKSKIGVNSSKTFFIITSKEEEVKKYIMKDLNHDLTEFNVKGGYSNHKNKIIMTAMDAKDYYRLREGVKTIDPKSFISIIDSHEVINKNKNLEKNN